MPSYSTLVLFYIVENETNQCLDYFGKAAWLGAQRDVLNCSGHFQWKPLPGQTIPMNYTNWLSGEPSCVFNGEFCMAMVKPKNYTWNDADCNITMCALCE